ncbi:MAG: DUF5658 family protein [Chloroflexota bacterium]
MTVALIPASRAHPPTDRRPIPSRPPFVVADVACWAVFAVAAVIFALDAIVTIHVLAVQPLAFEQNPIARWTLGTHPAAPLLLKGAIVAECAIVIAIVRFQGERWAAWVVSAMVAATGLLGIATAANAVAG